MLKGIGMRVFAERLKELRLEAGLNQSELASATNVNQTTISSYELDKISPTAEMIVIFCKFFKVSSDYMLGLSDDF